MTQGFSFQVANWNRKVLNLMDRTLQKFAKEMHRGVAVRSPIRTGRYRASHRIGVGTPDRTVEPKRDSLSPLVIGTELTADEVAYAAAMTSKLRFGMTVYITNGLPYAKPLEDGSSAQNGYKPDGIYGDAYREVAGKVPEVVRAVRAETAGVSLERT